MGSLVSSGRNISESNIFLMLPRCSRLKELLIVLLIKIVLRKLVPIDAQ